MKFKKKYLAVIVALIFNAILPAFFSFHYTDSSKSEIAALKKIYGETAKILICTESGTKYVSISDLQKDKSQPNKQKPQCPLCVIALYKDKIYSPAYAKLNSTKIISTQIISFEVSKLKNFNLHSSQHSRAPPYFS